MSDKIIISLNCLVIGFEGVGKTSIIECLAEKSTLKA
jgi:GTPase SAR1 family protein